jgi:hypothetical protein
MNRKFALLEKKFTLLQKFFSLLQISRVIQSPLARAIAVNGAKKVNKIDTSHFIKPFDEIPFFFRFKNSLDII